MKTPTIHNAAVLHVQKSMALDPVRSNCKTERDICLVTSSETPLPKCDQWVSLSTSSFQSEVM